MKLCTEIQTDDVSTKAVFYENGNGLLWEELKILSHSLLLLFMLCVASSIIIKTNVLKAS